MDVRPLVTEEAGLWTDFTARFTGVGGEEPARWLEGAPRPFADGIRVAVSGGRLVGGLWIFPRPIYLGGQRVEAAGVADLSVDPAYARADVIGALLSDAVRYLADRGVAIGFLAARERADRSARGLGDYGTPEEGAVPSPRALAGRSTREPALLAGQGWKAVPMELTVAQVAATRKGDYTVAPSNPRDRAEARQLQLIHEAFAPAYDGVAVRADLAYWAEWLPSRWDQALVARVDGRPVGYLSAQWSGPTALCIEDFASQTDAVPAVFLALVGALARSRRLESVQVTFPRALPVGLTPLTQVVDPSPTYRVILPHALPVPSARALNRLIEGDVAGHLTWSADWW